MTAQLLQDGGPVGPGDMIYPADHHLRRIDHMCARHHRISLLAPGERGAGKDIGPADIIPVVNVERERDHVLARGKLVQERIRWGAGRTALRREKLDHNGAGLGLRPANSHRDSADEVKGCKCRAHVTSYPHRLTRV